MPARRPFAPLLLAPLLLALILTGLAVQARAEAVNACAIRWDAWYSNDAGDPGHDTAITLGNPKYRQSAPLHAAFDADGSISWRPTQASFDAEIEAAHRAGLCWAYLAYGADAIVDLRLPMMRGLAFHRASALKNLVPYALIATTSTIGSARDVASAGRAIARLMGEANYKTVELNGARRPLLFLFYDAHDVASAFGGDLALARRALDTLRHLARDQGSGDPYIVVLASPAGLAESLRRALGADAISEYVAGRRTGKPESWAAFAPSIEDDWRAYAAATQAQAVPLLRSGADIRARCERPPRWERRFKPGDACGNYVEKPDLDQLKAEFLHARDWILRPEAKNPARLLLIYSWSECDESGNCLMPTLGDPTGQKLKAIGAALGGGR
ncbi:hypothetical protein CCR94_05060 [Rhodoblastus sphagnicola]|uniref:Uncharacterized protein n=1 Tax=Rhodoblastus sphagnicola TaxID=333368 RepID=A0A2S6ND62_9HYPH|nr:hypothetical protein [Rhodoblastus sphagnicola]MBB4198013.1 hypothetical protein [Rhodoblastus sphagnicola]PPQ32552.1 hypothetical protein CCR94_05060 [Rhodoblastus sphagnicola]